MNSSSPQKQMHQQQKQQQQQLINRVNAHMNEEREKKLKQFQDWQEKKQQDWIKQGQYEQEKSINQLLKDDLTFRMYYKHTNQSLFFSLASLGLFSVWTSRFFSIADDQIFLFQVISCLCGYKLMTDKNKDIKFDPEKLIPVSNPSIQKKFYYSLGMQGVLLQVLPCFSEVNDLSLCINFSLSLGMYYLSHLISNNIKLKSVNKVSFIAYIMMLSKYLVFPGSFDDISCYFLLMVFTQFQKKSFYNDRNLDNLAINLIFLLLISWSFRFFCKNMQYKIEDSSVKVKGDSSSNNMKKNSNLKDNENQDSNKNQNNKIQQNKNNSQEQNGGNSQKVQEQQQQNNNNIQIIEEKPQENLDDNKKKNSEKNR